MKVKLAPKFRKNNEKTVQCTEESLYCLTNPYERKRPLAEATYPIMIGLDD